MNVCPIKPLLTSLRVIMLLPILLIASLAFHGVSVAGPPPFYWEFINVEIDVQENGDMLITETQKYVFIGPYTNERYRYIPLDKVDWIDRVQVFEKGKELAATTGAENNQLWIRWSHTLKPPESHTFVLKYRVVGGVQLVESLWGKIRDARVYWKAIFKDRTTFIQRAKVTVRLPDPLAGQIRDKRAWGVPALAREVDAQTVEFVSRGPLSRGKKLEVYVQFPHGLLSVPAPAWQLQEKNTRLPPSIIAIVLALVVFAIFHARRGMRACHACDRPGLRPTGRSKTYGGGRQLELECSYCNSQEWKLEGHFSFFGGVGFSGAGGGGGGGGG
ncbi:MAG: DUF2207 domain-containing protein [Candidatus Binatia bacterium]